LLGAANVSLPASLVLQKAREQFAARVKRASEDATTPEQKKEVEQMLNWESFEKYLAEEDAAIRRALALSFAVQAVVEKEELEVDPQAIQDNLDMYAIDYFKTTGEKLDKEDPYFLERFEATYLREMVLRFVIDSAQVKWFDPEATA